MLWILVRMHVGTSLRTMEISLFFFILLWAISADAQWGLAFWTRKNKEPKRLLLTRRGKQGAREHEGPHGILGHEKEAVQMRVYRYNLTFAVREEVQSREGSWESQIARPPLDELPCSFCNPLPIAYCSPLEKLALVFPSAGDVVRYLLWSTQP